MPKATIHYVIINHGSGEASVNFYADAKTAALKAELEEEKGEAFDELGPHRRLLEWDDKGALVNPHSTKDELRRELAMVRGDDELGAEEEETTGKFNKAAADTGRGFTVKLHYMVSNGSDGSASARFYADAQSAQLADDIEQEKGEAFGDQPKSQTLTFDKNGLLTNPDETYAEVKAALAERRGEEPEESAAPKRDLEGVTVVFTGRLSTMTREQAEADAVSRGATIGSGISRTTDILVYGEDAGSKLEKAQKRGGVTIFSEAAWLASKSGKRAKPGPSP